VGSQAEASDAATASPLPTVRSPEKGETGTDTFSFTNFTRPAGRETEAAGASTASPLPSFRSPEKGEAGLDTFSFTDVSPSAPEKVEAEVGTFSSTNFRKAVPEKVNQANDTFAFTNFSPREPEKADPRADVFSFTNFRPRPADQSPGDTFAFTNFSKVPPSESDAEGTLARSELEDSESTEETSGPAAKVGPSSVPRAQAQPPDTSLILARIASLHKPEGAEFRATVATDFGQKQRRPAEEGGFSY
jgi:hypothetical protein